MRRSPFLVGLLASASLGAAPVDFAHEVVPILRKHCSECHTGDKKKGGLSMNTRASLLEGGENGAVVSLVQAQKSKLLEAVVSADPDIRMPPKGDRLSPAEVATLRTWVEQGAVWTDGFAFKQPAYEPPLRPRQPVLPAVKAGRTHPIDRVLDGWLAAKGAPTPPAADDATFQRRVSLDLVGMLPSAEEARAFAADRRPDKRTLLVRSLLARNVDYADHWMVFWNDLLRNDYAGTGYIDGGRKQITNWLYLSLLANKPYDQFTRELVAPSADSEGFAKGIIWRGAVSAGQVPELQYAQSVSQTFLGINMKCASCHDSFIDRWKLRDAYGLAAIYADKPMELVRCDIPTGKAAVAAWPFPELGQVDATKPRAERLAQLATLVTHPENGRFQRTIVNRLWQRLMGRGVVHPVDAMQSQPWNQDLLDVLANRLVESKYDLKTVLEYIATSQAYQSRSEILSRDAEDKGYVYRGPRAKRLTAEQFVDAVWRLTGTTPAKIELKVPRANPTAASAKKPVIEPLVAAPIWSGDIAGGRLPAAGETRSFRHQLVLDADVESATCVITCDNGFELYVNGKKIGTGDNWADPKSFDLSSALLKGANQVVVVGSNAGSSPNIAALFFQVNVSLKGGARVRMATDASWEWTTSVPNARGTFAAAGKAKAKVAEVVWQPVALVKSEAWRKAEVRMAEMLAGVDGMSSLPARASLMKSDMLQRALGRPNREQIVSMRPNELSTLEAIDLSNGQALTNLLAAGAAKLKKRSWSSPEELTRWLYVSALCREPAPAELKVAAGMVGPDLSEQGIADLLWAVCMLPEFQTIR
jgi:cytochrome c551/c552